MTLSALTSANFQTRASTGIAGLDTVLQGGLTPNRVYLVEGSPGAGKTTLALQFLLEGVARGEKGLYITLAETSFELNAVAESHGWDLSPLAIFELIDEDGLDPDATQSILHPAEVELGETIKKIMACVEQVGAQRIAFDSLSELRLLAQNPLRYRRQILTLKHFFAQRNSTVMLLDDRTSETGDVHLHSIAHGVISLDATVQEFGSERRNLRVVKLRGVKYQGGYHDFNIEQGGLRVFPRLVAAQHHRPFEPTPATTGTPRLDDLLGGGLVPGTNMLLMGPSGVGKTTTAVSCCYAALQRGQRVAYYLFDEGVATLVARAAALGMDLQPFMHSGQLELMQIDPAELSPGEFANRVCTGVNAHENTMVVIDSLNA
ncbi:MAG TPA: ATPase domain-containing protein, partial [Burkholderiaceae bacterium]